MSEETRVARAEDEGFLFELYADTRQEEMDAWGWDPAQRDGFLRMQFTARQRAYAEQYPQVDSRIVLRAGCPIGRTLVDRGTAEIRLVDIALLAGQRGTGIGTALINDLLAEAVASGKPVRLDVLKASRAVRLYERLGFALTGDSGVYLTMEWRHRPEGVR